MCCKKAVIDRFEGQTAVCELENKQFINVNKKLFNYTAKEGDHILIHKTYVIRDEQYHSRKIDLDEYFDK
jgi:hypothetical protein